MSIEHNQIPDWNFTILVNDFDDGYWDTGVENECPKEFIAISNLSKKYRNYLDWASAMQIYEDNIQAIIDYYGGQMLIDFMFEAAVDYPP